MGEGGGEFQGWVLVDSVEVILSLGAQGADVGAGGGSARLVTDLWEVGIAIGVLGHRGHAAVPRNRRQTTPLHTHTPTLRQSTSDRVGGTGRASRPGHALVRLCPRAGNTTKAAHAKRLEPPDAPAT